jgi:ketosteroid isomerase-like protein
VVGGLVVLGGGAVVAYRMGVFGGGGDPEQVVSDFFAASQRGDCDEMVDLVTEATWRASGATTEGQAVAECEASQAQVDTGADVRLESTNLVNETGDVTVVAATFTVTLPPDLGGGAVTDTVDYALRKEGGRWRIDAASGEAGAGVGLSGAGASDLPAVSAASGEPGELGESGPGAVSTAGMSADDIVSLFYEALAQGDCVTMGAVTYDTFWDKSVSSEPITLDMDTEKLCRDNVAAGLVRTDLTYLNSGEFEVRGTSVFVLRSFGSEPVASVLLSLSPRVGADDDSLLIWGASLGDCAPEEIDQQDCGWGPDIVPG